jgi:hypothetical protein
MDSVPSVIKNLSRFVRMINSYFIGNMWFFVFTLFMCIIWRKSYTSLTENQNFQDELQSLEGVQSVSRSCKEYALLAFFHSIWILPLRFFFTSAVATMNAGLCIKWHWDLSLKWLCINDFSSQILTFICFVPGGYVFIIILVSCYPWFVIYHQDFLLPQSSELTTSTDICFHHRICIYICVTIR